MNRREARRLATQKVAAAARRMANEVSCQEFGGPADGDRMVDAFCDIAFALEKRLGMHPRNGAERAPDPDQYSLFPADDEEPPQ